MFLNSCKGNRWEYKCLWSLISFKTYKNSVNSVYILRSNWDKTKLVCRLKDKGFCKYTCYSIYKCPVPKTTIVISTSFSRHAYLLRLRLCLCSVIVSTDRSQNSTKLFWINLREYHSFFFLQKEITEDKFVIRTDYWAVAFQVIFL